MLIPLLETPSNPLPTSGDAYMEVGEGREHGAEALPRVMVESKKPLLLMS